MYFSLIIFILGFSIGIITRQNLLKRSPKEKIDLQINDFLSLNGISINTPQLLAWIDVASQGWIILTPAFDIAYINIKAQRLLQITGKKLVQGHSLSQIIKSTLLNDAIREVRQQQLPQRVEFDVNNIPLEAYVHPGIEECLLVLLSSRRSIEAQQQQQERWLSDVAHELKTPLTALILVSDRLEQIIPGKDSVLVDRMQRELQRLQKMLEDLFELSRLENKQPIDNTNYIANSIEDLLENAWNTIRPIAELRNVNLITYTDEPGLILGDKQRLQRALINLLDNALRYSPENGSIEVDILPKGLWWLIKIRDHGPGLSEIDLSNMFQRFYRGDISRKRTSRSGSGLGLAIVEQIIISHGGSIKAENHPEGGTSIELLLPKGKY